ncbi:class F sortase [Virgibacillus flavescens]|uniref:class F sortase n=1 Tax=Virgibacillus flavescens TaxID=1611422 RepID=UPI003D34F55E
MRKIISILLLVVLVGCSQAESTDSNQPEPKETKEKTTETQKTAEPETETKNVSADKNSDKKTFYSDAFDQGVTGVIPKKIVIESLGVEAVVEGVGLLKDGKLSVPENYNKAGWYKAGAQPGEQGSSAISGHVTDPEGDAIFHDLNKLEAGDEVKVIGENGETRTFVVVDKAVYDLGKAPLKQIFGYTPRRMLNLITCTGDYIEEIDTFDQRLVVYTELKAE